MQFAKQSFPNVTSRFLRPQVPEQTLTPGECPYDFTGKINFNDLIFVYFSNSLSVIFMRDRLIENAFMLSLMTIIINFCNFML